MPRAKKKKKSQLPKELIYIPNQDKSFHEKYEGDEDPLDFTHPVRILLASGAKPNLRKTNTAKNIVVRQQPPFERIYLIHCGGKVTKEYEDFNAELLEEIPEPYDTEVFDPKVKTLLILEDLNFRSKSKKQLKNLDRLYGYTSTHQNLSIICCVQNFFSIPHGIRMMSNVFIVWKAIDRDQMEIIRRRLDCPKDKWHGLLDLLKQPWDSLWFDFTSGTKYPIRINGYTIVEQASEKKEEEK